MQNIFLVGMMGSGKSSIGPVLSRHLGKTFADTDAIIESKGKSIQQIFAQDGEEAFRQIEHEVLLELCQKTHLVIATGGGSPIWHDGMAIMKAHGLVIYLNVPCSILAERIASDPGERPLLNIDLQQLESKLQSLLDEREAVYKQADLVINNDRDISQTMNDLSSLIASN